MCKELHLSHRKATPRAWLGQAWLAVLSLPGPTPVNCPTMWPKKGASAEVLAVSISPAQMQSWLPAIHPVAGCREMLWSGWAL